MTHLAGLPQFDRAMKRMVIGADAAGREATAHAAHLVESETKKDLGAKVHGHGTPTPSQPGEPPATVTGTLKRGVHVEGPTRMGFGTYKAQVGPTVVYSRVQELGGDTGRGHAVHLPKRPYLGPALDRKQHELSDIYREAWSHSIHAH